MDNIHIIGFSMGAHIAGFAGKRIEGQVQRITGIDIKTDNIHYFYYDFYKYIKSNNT